MPVPYDPAYPDLAVVRLIFLNWLRSNPNAQQLDHSGTAYERLVEYVGNNRQPGVLAFHITEVFWQLVVEGIVAPGINAQAQMCNVPWFHVTDYGKKVLAADTGHP
jgi:hypothetical protein